MIIGFLKIFRRRFRVQKLFGLIEYEKGLMHTLSVSPRPSLRSHWKTCAPYRR